jgi:mRNA interferase RelE/StbE
MYEIIFHDVAKKQLKKLPISIQSRIVSKLERLRFRPHSFVKRLIGSPYFRLRVGDHRVIVDIKNNILVILVLELGHRKNIYKTK